MENLIKDQTLTKAEISEILSEKWKEADDLITKFLIAYGACSLFLAYFYDTWILGAAVSAAIIGSYFAIKKLAKGTHLHRYFASLAFGMFMALFIYQMHGLFEMHFFAFIGSTIMVAYQKWKLQIPITLFVVVHHGVFGYLQYTGVDNVYFTQLNYMDLQTFIFHVSLAAVIFSICGLWAYKFKNYAIRDGLKSQALQKAYSELEKYNKYLSSSKKELALANKNLNSEKEKLVELTNKQTAINSQLVSEYIEKEKIKE